MMSMPQTNLYLAMSGSAYQQLYAPVSPGPIQYRKGSVSNSSVDSNVKQIVNDVSKESAIELQTGEFRRQYLEALKLLDEWEALPADVKMFTEDIARKLEDLFESMTQQSEQVSVLKGCSSEEKKKRKKDMNNAVKRLRLRKAVLDESLTK